MKQTVSRLMRTAVAAVLLVVLTGCSGCLWIAIPSLAYQGYKAEESPKSRTAQSKSPDNSRSTKKDDSQFE